MEGNTLTSYENLCKIFEMRIKLNKENGVKTSFDVMNNYEKYAKKIDAIYNTEFQKELKNLISPSVTLEKEKDRLRRLIRLLEDRLDKRVELEDRYYNATGNYMSGLQIIVSEDELNDKKERLTLISKYLDTKEEIESVTESIDKLKDLLVEEENKKLEYEDKNKIMEDELYSTFRSLIKEDSYFSAINEEDINIELDNISGNVNETRETLDVTKDSVGSLMSSDPSDEYASYIEEAERNYYGYKNKEIILNIYKLVVEFEDDFKLLCAKRERINDLLKEKRELSDSLTIEVGNELLAFENVVISQNKTIDNEREVLDNILNYNNRINFKEERLEELKEANNTVEILALLREYGLIETYETTVEEDNLDISSLEEVEEVTYDNVNMDSLDNNVMSQMEYNPYRIVSVNDYPRTLNVGLARLKGESVREKVNRKLNPKEETTTLEEQKIITAPEVLADNKNLEVKIEEPLVSSPVVETSVWGVPSEIIVNKVDDVSDTLPVWGNGEDVSISEKVNIIDNSLNDNAEINSGKEDVMSNENAFWMPISGVKNNSQPTVNIPTNNSFNSNGDFVFPTINN